MTTFKPGDFVSFICGGPGPDIIQAVVLEVVDGRVVCYDPSFGFECEFNHVPNQYNNMRLATERELSSGIGTPTGSVVIRDLLTKARDEQMELTPDGWKRKTPAVRPGVLSD